MLQSHNSEEAKRMIKKKAPTKKDRTKPVCYMQPLVGKTEGPLGYHEACRLATKLMQEMVVGQSAVPWSQASVIIYRTRNGLTVELCRYVYDLKGRIKRRFPEVPVGPALAGQPLQGVGRQLTLRAVKE